MLYFLLALGSLVLAFVGLEMLQRRNAAVHAFCQKVATAVYLHNLLAHNKLRTNCIGHQDVLASYETMLYQFWRPMPSFLHVPADFTFDFSARDLEVLHEIARQFPSLTLSKVLDQIVS